MKFPIPQDWDGQAWCRWSICWPDSESWRGLLRGFITLPQRGWTWDERTGNILDVQQIGREITANNLPLNGVIMACNDENIANSFLDIAAAIRLLANQSAKSGCCDSPEIVIQNSIQGFVVQPVGGNSIPVYGSEPPIGLGPGEYPPRYDNEAEYKLEKCQVANLIVDKFIKILRDLGSISNFDFYALGGTVIAIIAFNLAFPPALIPTLIGAMIVLAVAAYYLPQFADYVQENREEWVCTLYESSSTDLAIAAIADLIDLALAFLTIPGPYGPAIKLIAMVLMNSDNLNALFNGFAAYGYPDADCSSCGCNTTGQAEFYEVNGVTWGSGDLSVNCEERVLTSNVYAAGTWHFVGLVNAGANDLLVEAISADPGIYNNGQFGGMSGFGAFTMYPGGDNLYFGGQDTPFTMVVKISGLDTVNGV